MDGQSLSDEEVIALSLFLDNAAPQERQQILNDLYANDLLLEHFAQQDAAWFDESTPQFVSRVQQRIAQQPPSVEPPPVVMQTTPAAQRPKSERAEPKRPSRSSNTWLVAATAASILLVAVSAAIYTAHVRHNRQQAGKPPETSGQPATKPGRVPEPDTVSEPGNRTQRAPQAVDLAVPATTEPEIIVATNQTDSRQQGPDSTPRRAVTAGDRAILPNEVAVTKDPRDPADPPAAKAQAPLIAKQDSPSSQYTPVVSVLEESDAVWGDGFDPAAAAASEKIQLASGKARLRLGKGTELTLNGSTELNLDNENSITLKSGSLAAFVPESATGFQVDAPGARIVDLGTKFSVQVGPDDPFTLVHVTEGQVDAFQPPIHPRGRERRTHMLAGKMKWFSREGKEAFDWLLKIEFGDHAIEPTHLSIDGEVFDLSQVSSQAAAMNRLAKSFRLAEEQLEQVARGERFLGQLTINDVSQRLVNKNHLAAAQTLLTAQVQKRFGTSVGLNATIQMMDDLQLKLREALRQN